MIEDKYKGLFCTSFSMLITYPLWLYAGVLLRERGIVQIEPLGLMWLMLLLAVIVSAAVSLSYRGFKGKIVFPILIILVTNALPGFVIVFNR